MLRTSTLRPGLLVSLKTSVTGNVSYARKDIEVDHIDEADGQRKARWETARSVRDPKEHERAQEVRGKASTLIRGVCAYSAFGLLCPESSGDDLEKAIADARVLADEFNATATITRVNVYVLTGRIAPDDVEAVRAINSEVRDLLSAMETGVKNLDVKVIREAASKARQLGTMLTPDAATRIGDAIDAARSSARKIVAAGENAAVEVDGVTLRALAAARTAFLDIDEAAAIKAPTTLGRAIDFDPSVRDPSDTAMSAMSSAVPQFAMEL